MNEVYEWVQWSSWPSKTVINIMIWCTLKCLWQTKPLKEKQNWSCQQSLWNISIIMTLHLFSSFHPRKNTGKSLLYYLFRCHSYFTIVTFIINSTRYRFIWLAANVLQCPIMSNCGQKQRSDDFLNLIYKQHQCKETKLLILSK